jgi:hypothetical protein
MYQFAYIQYFEDFFEGIPTSSDYIKYLSLTAGTIFVYFLTFNEYKTVLYFKEKSHPHPVIRILGSIGIVFDSFKNILNHKGLNVNLDKEILFPEALRISELFIRKFHGDFEFEELKEKMKDQFKDINAYYEELKSYIVSNPNSAINRRNDIINKKKKHSI